MMQFRRVRDRARLRTTTMVLEWLRFRFATAMAPSVTLFVFFVTLAFTAAAVPAFAFFPNRLFRAVRIGKFPASFHRTASTGLIREAMRHGFRQEIHTVIRDRSSPPAKTTGLAVTSTADASPANDVPDITTGIRNFPTSHPASRPSGIPTADSRNACRYTIFRSCLPVVPTVFSRP